MSIERIRIGIAAEGLFKKILAEINGYLPGITCLPPYPYKGARGIFRDGGIYFAFDNSDGECYTEEFTDINQAFLWFKPEQRIQALLRQRAGEKYRPSNGTEGQIFFSGWCYRCTHYHPETLFQSCQIRVDTMTYQLDDSNYPSQWRYDSDGEPECTSFEAKE